jgi:hypothetical protein
MHFQPTEELHQGFKRMAKSLALPLDWDDLSGAKASIGYVRVPSE